MTWSYLDAIEDPYYVCGTQLKMEGEYVTGLKFKFCRLDVVKSVKLQYKMEQLIITREYLDDIITANFTN